MLIEFHIGKFVAAAAAMCLTIATGGVGYAFHQEGRLSTVEAKVDAQRATVDDTNRMVRDLYQGLLKERLSKP